ncbi:MAG: glycine cleavage system protein GcvH [Candidatus Nezhaarchaeota archaeon]|nr:glycine cleavage system protein GcvH [Candidatus Nezhaarchaeota archaeon]
MRSEVPPGLLYSKDHVWIKVEGDLARLGITDYAQKQLREVLYVELPEKGRSVERGGVIASLESIKAVVDVVSPLACEVVEANSLLQEKPELINLEPYGKGWIALVKPLDAEQLGELVDSESYKALIEQSR